MLTGEYVFETYGHEAHVRATWPERAAELALRADASLEDVVLMQTVLAGPDNEPQASARPAIRAGDAVGAPAAWTDCYARRTTCDGRPSPTSSAGSTPSTARMPCGTPSCTRPPAVPGAPPSRPSATRAPRTGCGR
jgi:hypothetical protein